jgi:hypothetical protein
MLNQRKSNRKSKVIAVRFTPSEFEALELAAKASGQTISQWARCPLIWSADLVRIPNRPVIGGAADAAFQESDPDPRTGWGEGSINPGDVVTIAPPARTWSDEWREMEKLTPPEAILRFNELRAGRALPEGFRGWPKGERVMWLDREWPL